MVGILESHMASNPLGGGAGINTRQSSGNDPGVTSQRLEVCFGDWWQHLIMNSLCIDGAKKDFRSLPSELDTRVYRKWAHIYSKVYPSFYGIIIIPISETDL